MQLNNYNNLILSKGFQSAHANLSNISIFFRKSVSEILDVCILIDNTQTPLVSPLFLNELFHALERKFLFQGFKKLNPFYIIFSDNIERDKIFCEQPHPYWIVDVLCNQIMIYDLQPENYFELREGFETLLHTPVKRKFVFSKTFPFMTALLIFFNVLIFILLELAGNTENSYFMLQHGASYWKYIYEDGQYYRLFTCMFLHFGAEHLMNNMITLAVIGTETERFLGHLRFLFIYVFSGIGASVLSSVYYMNNNTEAFIISAGASGAIYGVLGAFVILALLYKNLRKQIQPFYLILILVLSLSNGYFSTNIDNVGHISGLLFGIILTFISTVGSFFGKKQA